MTTIGAWLIFLGGVIFVFNMVQSYIEGPRVEDGGPWNLKDDGLATQEWLWFEDKIETQLATDGRDVSDERVPTDVGEDPMDTDD